MLNTYCLIFIKVVEGYLRSNLPIKHNVGAHDEETQLEGW